MKNDKVSVVLFSFGAFSSSFVKKKKKILIIRCITLPLVLAQCFLVFKRQE